MHAVMTGARVRLASARLTRASAAAVLVAALSVQASSAADTVAAGARPCPALKTIRFPRSITDVARGSERLLGRAFARYVDERHTTTIIHIKELASLAGTGTATDAGLRRWQQLGARRCGRVVTDASWLIVFSLPEAKLPSTGPFVAIVALTEQGLRLWYSPSP